MEMMRLPMRTMSWNTIGLMVSLTLFLCFSMILSAEGAKNPFKVGVLDPQLVMEKSKAGSRALATFKEHAKARENVLKSDQQELERLQEELKKGEGTLTDEDKRRKQEELSKKFQAWQQRGQEYRRELAQKQQELNQEFMDKIQKAVGVVAKKHSFSLVVDKGTQTTKIVLYNRKGLDITNEVIKEFNRQYK